jgi:hypothetical protein
MLTVSHVRKNFEGTTAGLGHSCLCSRTSRPVCANNEWHGQKEATTPRGTNAVVVVVMMGGGDDGWW